MPTEEQHVALPKLYGAPAYARPVAPVATAARPFDPDDLPIEVFQTSEEQELLSRLPARAWAPGGALIARSERQGEGHRVSPGEPQLRPRPLSLRRIAGRLLGSD